MFHYKRKDVRRHYKCSNSYMEKQKVILCPYLEPSLSVLEETTKPFFSSIDILCKETSLME